MEKQEIIDEINNFLAQKIEQVHPYINSDWELAKVNAYKTVLAFIETLNK